ncbi:MAG: hypothetical protein WDN00_02355 [Limisphaerales bacterium]
MVQVDMNALKAKGDIEKYYLGSMLSGGGSDPADNLPATWLQTVNEYQSLGPEDAVEDPLDLRD